MQYDLCHQIRQNTDAHRTLPFWSWNDHLSPEELTQQIHQMKAAGMGGYFMHARAGLITPYMGEDWMQAIDACLNEGEALQMESWAYDENGWPSGFGNGIVPQMGEAYQQKGLDFRIFHAGETLPDRTLGIYRLCGDHVCSVSEPAEGDTVVFVVVNRYYIDALNAEAITHFLKCSHDVYYERFGEDFGTKLKGFFTDEPQYANGLIPWSPALETAFAEEWGYSPLEKLGALFLTAGGEKRFRWQYYQTASRLICEGFVGQMQHWCHDHGIQLTGHMMAEDSLWAQLRCTGGVMPAYEYFDIPGVDWLGRQIASPAIPKQLGSAAAQLGKKRTLSESFALCGWDVSFNELRWIAQWQYVNGVNLLCQHLSAYSIQGLRKRDYPASLHIQSPWFEVYRPLQDYFARTGAALAEGADMTDVLLVHPLGDAAGNQNRAEEAEVWKLSHQFDGITAELSGLHILHHYGDETLMRRHGRVENGFLYVGKQAYRVVILPHCESIAPATAKLLTEFLAGGGKVLSIGQTPKLVGFAPDADWMKVQDRIQTVPDVSAVAKVLYGENTVHIQNAQGQEESQVHLMRRMLPDGRTMLYLVSLSLEDLGSRELILPGHVGLREVDLTDLSEQVLSGTFDGAYTHVTLSFGPAQSHLLVSCEPERSAEPAVQKEILRFLPTWEIGDCTPNAITLDKGAYQVDGGPWQPEKAIILIQQELLALRRPCQIALKLTFTIEELEKIGNLELVMEQPERYEIMLNGKSLPFTDTGWYLDKSFRRCPIQSWVKEGTNTLVLSGSFSQPQHVYETLFTENVHEVEINKLTYDTELENLYILGDFSVKANAEPTYGARRGVWAGQDFVLCPSEKQIKIEDITTRGYWFFAGKMRLRQSITVTKAANTRYVVEAEKLHVPAARVWVNGKEAGLLYIAPFSVDVTDFLHDGENVVEIELLTGNRNLLGPHHRVRGESYLVAPATFGDGPDWEGGEAPYWRDDYCFVTTGIQFADESNH